MRATNSQATAQNPLPACDNGRAMRKYVRRSISAWQISRPFAMSERLHDLHHPFADTFNAFRNQCRHNHLQQRYGAPRDSANDWNRGRVGTILDAGFVHDDSDQVAPDVGNDAALSAPGLLSGVEAPGLPPPRLDWRSITTQAIGLASRPGALTRRL
jgi:hypothetical protein